MEEFEIFLKVLLGIAAGIVTLGGAIAVVQRVSKPASDLVDRVEHNADCLDRDNKRINALENSNNLMLRAQMQLLQHAINGNHIDQMQETYDEIQDYLIKR